MKRFAWLAVVAVVCLVGCHPEPKFPGPEEEYRYLRSLSNPTPEQYLRREELGRQPAPDTQAIGMAPHDPRHWTIKDAVEAEDEGQRGFESLPK